MQVYVGGHQDVVVGLLLHEERPGEGEGDLGALFHHVPQLACQLQGALFRPFRVLPVPWPAQRGLDEQR